MTRVSSCESVGLGAGFECLVLAPAGLPGARVLRAAERAGGIGIATGEAGAIGADLAAFHSAGGQRAGVLAANGAVLTALAADASPPAIVIAAPSALKAAAPAAAALRDGGCKILCEVIQWGAAAAELAASVDGYVLKGHDCAGLVSEDTGFVLLQTARRATELPLFVRGGVTPATAAAAHVGGAAGVVLDDQILLMAEAGLPDPAIRKRIAGFSGSETLQVEHPQGYYYLRALDRPGAKAADRVAARLAEAADPLAEIEAIAAELSWAADAALMPGGQGLTLARGLADQYGTVGRLIAAIRAAVETLPAAAANRRALAENGPLSQIFGTRYPIMQGPMTRVSDVSDFSAKVGEAGGLPFSALALLKGPQVETLLAETQEQMAGRPWGVGMLGFAPKEVLKPQFDAVDRTRPNFAIVAGGRINQVEWFENRGIPAFVHASTAGIIVGHLEDGMRRFVVEGRECGGHIGPLTSFTLWGAIVEALRDHPLVVREGAKMQIVFAGGIHDAASAAMAATIGEPLAARGVSIGILMGTGYLFTKEIVEAGAIVPDYQEVALACDGTQSLWEGPGFASRCAVTPIAEEFRQTRRDLEAKGARATEVREALEEISLGRLRMATKGLARTGPDKALTEIGPEQRHREGMYMIGQVAALRDEVGTIAELHDAVTAGAVDYLDAVAGRVARAPATVAAPPPADIAIVGMGALLPGSQTLDAYWRRILSGESAIRPIPEDRWDADAYFDADRTARDRVYSARGGFLEDVPFDPLAYGIPPSALGSIDPMQLLALELVSDVIGDAQPVALAKEERERVSVMLGFSGGIGETGGQYVARSELLRLFGADVPEEVLQRLPEWTEDSFSGTLPNVSAGRVTNRFDFGGTNVTVDAACASSLAAIYQAVLELETGRVDMAIAGGVDTQMTAFGYLCFAKTGALSPRGLCNTFDARADGIVISEGLAAVALKRRADAEAAGDRIYAVISGVGASSDGRAKGLTAPLPAGQMRAVHRAYAQAGYAPDTVALFEAHGTGTVAGDKAELETVSTVLRDCGAAPRSAAIGSVKTLIGHTKSTAGVAGLIKVALGLHTKTLPPHALVETPNPVFSDDDVPLYISQSPRPWVARPGTPRRAGVSAFGFGGTNFHIALEEYADPLAPAAAVELGLEIVPVAISAPTRADLAIRLEGLAPEGEEPLARFAERAMARNAADDPVRAGFVAKSANAARAALEALRAHLAHGAALPRGIHFSEAPELLSGAKLAFVFPGQGSQYPDMLARTALFDPAMIDRLDRAEAALVGTPSFADTRLAQRIYPGDAFDKQMKKAQMAALTATEIAQPALGAVESGLAATLAGLGVIPDMVAGHSYGEFVALHAAGALSFEELIRLSEARGRAMVANGDPDMPGAMAAVAADRAATEAALDGIEDVTIANLNSPSQTVIAGAAKVIEAATEALAKADLDVRQVPVSQAFHSPLMAAARADFDAALGAVNWCAPTIPVYSNTRGARHAEDLEAIRQTMSEHLVSPVDFVAMTRAMAEDGARVFVEVGPKSVLSSRIGEILGDVRTIALDRASGDAAALTDGLLELFVAGAAPDLAAVVARLATPGPRRLAKPARQPWLLNGGYLRPADAPRRNMRAPAVAPLPVIPASVPAAPVIAAAAPGHASPPAPTGRQATSTSKSNGLEFMDISPRHPSPGTGAGDRADVLSEYHGMMRDFLRMQENVMLAYLGQQPTAPSTQAELRPALSAPAPRPVLQVAAPAAIMADGHHQAAPVETALAPAMPAPAPVPEAPPAAHSAANGSATPAANGASAADGAGAPDAAEALTGEALQATFITLIADKTGYPEDALDLDQELEADLGVDSIKRMEILGALQKALPATAADVMREEMDSIAELSTIREITAFIDTKGAGGGSAPAAKAEEARPFDQAGEAEDRTAAVLPRFIQRAFAEPADHVARDLPEGMRVIVTEAADGFHQVVLDALAAAGVEGVALPAALLEGAPDALSEWLAEMRAERAPGALIYLGARESADLGALDLAGWRALHARVAKGFYRLLQALSPDLSSGGRVIAATEMGGLFGRVATRPEAAESLRDGAAGGGTVGLVKALSLEWPECSLKAVDLDGADPAQARAEHLVAELSFLRGRREVGYPAQTRTIFRTEPQSMAPPEQPGPGVDENWVVVATGGARGITAECLRTLAPHGPTLVLLGRSDEPQPEGPDTAGLDTAGLRRFYLDAARAEGEKPKPRDIEAQVQKHLGRRDMAQNLADLAALGARVEYRSVDVVDEAAMSALFEDLYARHGRIDMLVHGAGLIEDTFFEKKQAASVDRVFDTKVDAAFLMAKLVRPESLKAACFFTSVAGRYGNRGQTDYATANETLNRLAWDLARAWPQATVKAINWGPWGQTTTGAGMVTEDVRAQFLGRGIGMVEAAPGRDFFFKEMFWADRDEVESVGWVADGESMEEAACAIPAPEGRDRIGAPAILLDRGVTRENGKREVVWRFDTVSAPYVDHHRFDGVAVMPFVAMIQMFAEIPAIFGDPRPVIGVEDYSLGSGITLAKGAHDLHFTYEPVADRADAVAIEVRSALTPKRASYKGIVQLGDTLPEPPALTLVPMNLPRWEGPGLSEIYARWLSHGPVFQTIEKIEAFGAPGIRARIAPTPPTAFVPSGAGREWTFDPGLLDGMLQLIWIWTRQVQGAATLPNFGRRLRRFGAGPHVGPMRAEVEMLSEPDDASVRFSAHLFDAQGQLRLQFDDWQGQSTSRLNRLAGGWQGGERPARAAEAGA